MSTGYQYKACRAWRHSWNADMVLNSIVPLEILARKRKHISKSATHLLTSTTQCTRCHTFLREFYSCRFVSASNYTIIDRLPSRSYKYAPGYLIHDGRNHPPIDFKIAAIEEAIANGMLIEVASLGESA